MTELDYLLAQRACEDVVMAAARAVDAQDYHALSALFTDDGELVRPGGTRLWGRQAIFASYAAKDAARLTQHIVSNLQVTVDSVTTARSRCVVTLWTTQRGQMLTPQGRQADTMQQIGEIEDELLHTPDGWKIKRRRAQFTMYRSIG